MQWWFQYSSYWSWLQVEAFDSERKLIEAFVEAVRALDPDILLGWEVQQLSLGYIIDRAALLEINLLRELSRTPEASLCSCPGSRRS